MWRQRTAKRFCCPLLQLRIITLKSNRAGTNEKKKSRRRVKEWCSHNEKKKKIIIIIFYYITHTGTLISTWRKFRQHSGWPLKMRGTKCPSVGVVCERKRARAKSKAMEEQTYKDEWWLREISFQLKHKPPSFHTHTHTHIMPARHACWCAF